MEQMDSEYGELVYLLSKYFLRLGRKYVFMAMKQTDVAELGNDDFCKWLASLADITKHLNTLSLKLQGESNMIIQMSDNITAFKMRLKSVEETNTAKNFQHFPSRRTLHSVDSDAP